jgi:hypothetical protein
LLKNRHYILLQGGVMKSSSGIFQEEGKKKRKIRASLEIAR